MVRKKRYIIVLIFIFCLLVLLGALRRIKGDSKVNNSNSYTKLYEFLPSMPIEVLEDKMKKGESLCVFFMSADCPDCLNIEDTVINIISNQSKKKDIYFVNLYWLRNENKDKYLMLKKEWGFSQIPNFYMIENGEIIDSIEWTQQGMPRSKIITWMKKNKILL